MVEPSGRQLSLPALSWMGIEGRGVLWLIKEESSGLIAVRQHGGLAEEQAAAAVRRMELTGRYVVECWS